MSIKVYEAYIYKNISIQDFEDKLISISEHFKQKTKKTFARNVFYCYHKNLNTIDNDNKISSYKKIVKELKDRDNLLSSFNYDLNIDIQYIQYKNDIIIFLYYENEESPKAFLELLPELTDFSYYDNFDKPDTISHEEWNYRGDVYSNILISFDLKKCGFKPFRLDGFFVTEFTYDLFDNVEYSREDFLHYFLSNFLFNHFFCNLCEQKNIDISNINSNQLDTNELYTLKTINSNIFSYLNLYFKKDSQYFLSASSNPYLYTYLRFANKDNYKTLKKIKKSELNLAFLEEEFKDFINSFNK